MVVMNSQEMLEQYKKEGNYFEKKKKPRLKQLEARARELPSPKGEKGAVAHAKLKEEFADEYSLLCKEAQSSTDICKMVLSRNLSTALIGKQLKEINERIKDSGVESFRPDCEASLLMAIKGFTTAKITYEPDAEGGMKVARVIEEFIPPDYKAAVLLLKYLDPTKYGNLDTTETKVNVLNIAACEKDLERFKSLAGSLIERKIVESTTRNS